MMIKHKPLLYLLIIAFLVLFPYDYVLAFQANNISIKDLSTRIANHYNIEIVDHVKSQEFTDFTVNPGQTKNDALATFSLLLSEHGYYLEKRGAAYHILRYSSDIPTLSPTDANPSNLETFTYTVKNIPSADFTKSLAPLFTEGESIRDTGLNNTIIITASAQRIMEVKKTLPQLDQPKQTFENYLDSVIPINHLSGEEVTSIISTLFKDKYKHHFSADGSQLYISILKSDYPRLKHVIDNFDKIKKQVLVDVIVAEMSTGKATELGMQLAYNGGSATSAISYPSLNNILGSGISALTSGLVLSFVKDKFSFILENIETDSDTVILSTPSLIATEGFKASLVIGQSVPFKTGEFINAGGSTSNDPNKPFVTIERKDVGIKLSFQPKILNDGSINLTLEQELSSVAVSSAGAADLITNKRSISTNAIVANNDIIVLGGLVESSRSDIKDRSPILSRIPLLGKLFQHKRVSYSSTNLMIFIRPRILTSDSAYNRELMAQYIGMDVPTPERHNKKRGKRMAKAEEVIEDFYDF